MLEGEQREASEHAGAAPQIQQELSAKRAQLERWDASARARWLTATRAARPNWGTAASA